MKPRRRQSASRRSILLGLSNRKISTSKSPASHSPALQNRLILSQRSIRPLNLRKKHPKEIGQEVLVYVNSDDLYAELQLYSIRGLARFRKEEGQLRKDLLVISKIQEFYQQYNTFCSCNYPHCSTVTWIIFSNAINGEEIQNQFNRNYEPINFYFLKGMQDIVNFINFKQKMEKKVRKGLSFFSKIINFDAYNNEYACILEFGPKIQLFKPQENNQLWLISKQQLKKINFEGFRCYFLGEHSIKAGEIQLVESAGQKMLYLLLVEDFEIYLSSVGIKHYQETMDSSFLQEYLFKVQEQKYLQKVIPNYLSNETIINLVGFSTEMATVIQKQYGFVIRCNNLTLPARCHVYSVYYEEKRQNDELGIILKDNVSIKEQIVEIRNHFQAIANLQDRYEQISNYFSSFILASHNMSKDQFLSQLRLFTQKQIYQIKDLKQLRSIDTKAVILIGNLTQSQKKSLPNHVTVIETIDGHRFSHERVITAIIKLNTFDNGLTYISTISITNFSFEFKQLQSQKSNAYIQRPINDFSIFLSQVQVDSAHLVIMEMEEYTEYRQKQLKETQLLKTVNFEVYLLYGNEFIFRSKDIKYTFLKKDQLLTKIKNIMDSQISSQQDNLELQYLSDYNFHSDIQHNRSLLRNDTYSTPNLYYFSTNHKNIIICVPKSVPHHTLLDRSEQKYSLLVYSHIKQVIEMVKYLPSDYFVTIITTDKAKQENNSKNHEYIGVSELTEKAVREEIDRIISRFQLGKRQGAMAKKPRMSPVVVLFNNSHDKQIKIINKMRQIFENSKVMTISKKQFKTIKKNYSISEKIQLYQIGKPEIAFAKRLKNPLQIFKIFMSPHVASHEFSAQRLQFSSKQLFLRKFIEKNKNNRIKGSKQLSLSRSISPKAKSILQKQCFISQAGLVLLESKTINKLLKKQKFSSSDELLSLCLDHHSRGNQLLIVVSEEEFFELKDQVNVYGKEIIWIVLVNEDGKCIIREANIIFCREIQFDHTLALVTEAYRRFKCKSFQLEDRLTEYQSKKEKENSENILVKINYVQSQLLSSLESSQNLTNLNVYFNERIKQFRMSKLSSAFVFNNKTNLNLFLSNFSSKTVSQETDQNLQIICDQHNKRFLEQSLKVIEEDRYILITYEHISELSTYSSQSKAIFVFQKDSSNIKHPNSIIVSSQETPQTFSRRLKVFLLALRKIS